MLRVLTLSTLFPSAAKPTLGGFVERQTLGLAGHARAEVRVVAPVGLPPWPLSLHPHYRPLSGLPRREEWKGLIVHRPRFPVFPGAARWAARAMARAVEPTLREIHRSFPFDIINAEFFWPDGPAAMRLSRTFGVPFSVTARGADIQYWMKRRGIGSQILEAAEAAGGLLSKSDRLADAMAGFGMRRDRILTHYTGIDHDRFHPVDRSLAKAKLDVAGPLILTAGALIPRKGPLVAVAAVERIPQATLILVGEGPERKAVEKMVQQRNLTGRVRLLGNRPHAEVAELMAAADVMLLPSNSEGLANVWVEALASGTPVVTCDVGGAREVIDRPAAGAIVPRDPDAMADAVRAILNDPPAQAEVRKAAEGLSWEKNSAILFDHLSAIVARAKLS